MITAKDVTVNKVSVTKQDVYRIRSSVGVSQRVFAKLIETTVGAVRNWEQGIRKPSGTARVLLDLLDKSPRILDYKIK